MTYAKKGGGPGLRSCPHLTYAFLRSDALLCNQAPTVEACCSQACAWTPPPQTKVTIDDHRRNLQQGKSWRAIFGTQTFGTPPPPVQHSPGCSMLQQQICGTVGGGVKHAAARHGVAQHTYGSTYDPQTARGHPPLGQLYGCLCAGWRSTKGAILKDHVLGKREALLSATRGHIPAKRNHSRP